MSEFIPLVIEDPSLDLADKLVGKLQQTWSQNEIKFLLRNMQIACLNSKSKNLQELGGPLRLLLFTNTSDLDLTVIYSVCSLYLQSLSQ